MHTVLSLQMLQLVGLDTLGCKSNVSCDSGASCESNNSCPSNTSINADGP